LGPNELHALSGARIALHLHNIEVVMKTFIDIESGGFKAGEMLIMQARRTGKSSYYYPTPKNFQFEKVDEAIVDGEQWYSVRTRRDSEAGKWLREQDCAVEANTGWTFDSYFDVPEKIYSMLILKFQ
jgi:hypothetical protein